MFEFEDRWQKGCVTSMRKIESLNEKWYFLRGATRNDQPPRYRSKHWEAVQLPHTWQDAATEDEANFGWYCREFTFPTARGEQLFLQLCGACFAAKVYINGQKILQHENGFSACFVEITPYLKANGVAVIAIRVDNHRRDRFYPDDSVFPCYGGLYRDINLIRVPKSHFSFGANGTQGVAVTPVLQADGSADITVQALVKNAKPGQMLRFTLGDDPKTRQTVPVENHGTVIHLETPHLWQGTSDPYLYALRAELWEGEHCLDHLRIRFGVRSFAVDPERGFLLNGEPYPLRGVTLHPDIADVWSLNKRAQDEDISILRELGANALRLCLFQQSSYFYDLCDESGLVVWSEVPLTSPYLPAKKAQENILLQMKELILQNYNHASIAIWGVADGISAEGGSRALTETLQQLNDSIHRLDKTRLSVISHPIDTPLGRNWDNLTDLVAYTTIGAETQDAVADLQFLDRCKQDDPTGCFGLSAYGCQAYTNYDTQIQNESADTQLQTLYHEVILKGIAQRPFLWATFAHSLFDYAIAADAVIEIGLVSQDRKTFRDAFYLYKASWSTQPFVHICNCQQARRTSTRIRLKVYSNCSELALSVNGKEVAQQRGENIFYFENVPLQVGKNTLRITGAEGCVDSAEFFLGDAL